MGTKRPYTRGQVEHAAAVARIAVNMRVCGETRFHLMNLEEGGYCARFVRQVFERALGLQPHRWQYRAATAAGMLKKLAPYEIPLKDRQPGDILGFPTPAPGDCEHVAIYVGREFDPLKELVAENTSATRGWPRKPGTKVTSYQSLVKGRTVKCYRLWQ